MKRKLAAAAAIMALVIPATVNAWSEVGHQAIAFVAEQHLRPAALDQVNKMLAADIATSDGLDLQSAAGWADRYMQSDQAQGGERYQATVRWHFADIQAARPNIPAACFGQKPLAQGTPASKGPAEDCIISKIEQFSAELSDRTTPAAERLLALKYLINLVADAHQPLRVADEHDDHGALVPVSAKGLPDGDLFSYWDRDLVARLGPGPAAIAQRLKARITASDARLWASGTPHLWVLEAHQLAVRDAFGSLGRINMKGRFEISEADLEIAAETISLQLSRAGVRLAYVLNEALAPLPVTAARIVAPAGNPAAGKAFVMPACSVCHMVAPNQVSPQEFTTAPDFAAIANTRGISEDALREFLFGPHPTMPSIALMGHQANDVIAYILALKTPPAKPR